MPSSPASNAPALTDLVMPKLGLTMTEGVLAEWKVRPGDAVSAGEVIFVVETDKIANEVEAPGAGTIAEILVQAGETVPVGTPVARWTGKGFVAEAPEMPKAAPAPDAPKPVPLPVSTGARVRATPLARRIARARGVDLHAIAGSGPDGRIKAADVAAAAQAAPAVMPVAPPAAGGERIALSARYLAMVRRVVTARREIPDFQIVRTADVGALLDLRGQLNRSGTRKITINDMVLKAVGRALLAVPRANRIWDHDAHLAFAETDVGMVVDSEDGLFIPILRDVGRTPLDRLAADSAAASARAREGRLSAADMTGGAISVSNVGMVGATALTPIISPPQSAILGVGAVDSLFRPDAEGRPVPRREITLTLSCDHRVYDGVLAARLLQAIAGALEAPHSLLRTED